MYRKNDYIFRAGGPSSEVLMGLARKLVFVAGLAVALLLAGTYVVERHGVPGLRWNYEYVKVGDARIVVAAEYVTPIGLVDQVPGGGYGAFEFFPLPDEKRPLNLLKSLFSP